MQPNSYGRSLLERKAWAKILRKKSRVIMLNNSFNHENIKKKLFGCIWDRYKLIWNQTNNEKKLYSLTGQEALIGRYNGSQKQLKKMSRFIMNFFSGKDEIQFSNIDELRSLGYLQ